VRSFQQGNPCETLIILLITLITFASVDVAQSKKDKIEIGVQSTSLTIVPLDVFVDEPKGESLAELRELDSGVKIGKHFEKSGCLGRCDRGFSVWI
jgi:hypothetical protein